MPALSLPKGGGAIRGIGEKFSVNSINGTASLNVPIFTTPSRSDFYPKLSLSYDSGAGNGPFGLGWSLSVPSITRKTDKGLPQYRDFEDSDVYILSEAEDLVPVLVENSGQWARQPITFPQGNKVYAIQRYRPRIEGLFARIERWQDGVSGNTFWLSISRDNVISVYGATTQARIWDPQDPSHIFSWLLEETLDDRGNVVLYEYKQEDQANIDPTLPQEANRLANGLSFAARYLKRIRYGNQKPRPPLIRASEDNPASRPAIEAALEAHRTADDFHFQVVFDYGEHSQDQPSPNDESTTWPTRLDPFSKFRASFEIRTYRLCQRVLMFHEFPELGDTPCLVRSTDFAYNETPVSTYLTSVTQCGYIRDNKDGDYQKKSFPPLEFTYSQPTVDPEVHFIDDESLENLPIGLDGGNYQWVDLDSEGLSGILTQQSDAWYFKRNLGGKFGPDERLATQPSLADLRSGRQQLLDLAGDGEKCLVQFSEPVAGYYERDEEGQWQPFAPFSSNPQISWSDPNLKVIDLDGDGFSDVLISEDDVFTWYPSLAKDGFAPAQSVRKADDEDNGPALIFADATQSVFLADMCGDGLTDIARIRNGEICYWPNMGYGHFGPKVTMDLVPLFDNPEQFDPGRIRLADIDGSGTTDIIYLGKDSVSFWFNQAGNSWSQANVLPNFPPTDKPTSVTVVDLFGNGTACIVWSSPLPQDVREPMRYIDLMSSQKPHLLTSIRNNMGSETRFEYSASTKFYLEDSAAGTPWITKLPFPVQVVERVETRDEVTGTKLVNTYKYHHGYYDGIEREFRGFGLVEQWDTEDYAQFVGAGLFSKTPTAVEEELHVPPVRTETWFHTGAYIDRDNISQHFVDEYYKGDQQAVLLSDTNLPTGLTPDEEAEACRALKGRILRQEIYAEDGNKHPYVASEHTYKLLMIQPRQGNPHAVFFAHEVEALDYHYERHPADPRISHSVTLELDAFGNVTKAAAIGYPRRDSAFPEQKQTLITYTESDVINKTDATNFYRIGVPAETRTYELTGATRKAILFTPQEVIDAAQAADEIPYESKPAAGTTQRRLIERVRSVYYNDDLTGPLPLGDVGGHALPYQSYKMAFTPGLITQVYGNRVTDSFLANEGKYLFQDDPKMASKGGWWILSGRQVFDPAQFFLPVQSIDPFGNASTVSYDQYDLIVTKLVDPLQNAVSAQNNYRTMLPWRLIDPNNNRSAVRFDALGMVVATAVMGKAGQNEGDVIDEATSEASPADDPTTKLDYDLSNWKENGRPNFVHTSSREQHGAKNPRWQESYSYSDGFGRELMKKIQAEPGLAPARGPDGKLLHNDDGTLKLVDTSPNVRWVGTGRTVFNNKGKPVKKYEPFFSTTFEYEDEQDLVEWGVTPVLHYDPLERVTRTDAPNGTFSRVEFDAWEQITSDENDTVLHSQWYADRGSPAPTDPEPPDPETRAAWLAAKHADTPAVAHLDTLGRTFLTIADNGKTSDGMPQKYQTRVELDIEGNQRSVTDALGRKVMVYDYDMVSNKVHQNSVDAGERWVLNNVVGKPIRTWDSRGFVRRMSYDALQRPTALYVDGGQGERLAQLTGYGETQGDALNHRTRVYQVFDGAGIVTSVAYDFKGNLLKSSRKLLQNYKDPVDWSLSPPLEGETFSTSTVFDALNRPVALTSPDSIVIRPVYNEANLLEKLSADLHGKPTPFLKNLDYNTKGQRVFCDYANGVRTTYKYDEYTFRLRELKTVRSSDSTSLQDLSYTYDPVGNITGIDDAAQQTIFFKNAVVTANSRYVYDAIYRLIHAEGRESAGQGLQPEYDWNDLPRINLPQPGDGQAMRNYRELYQYDEVGNILAVVHQAINNGNWTRRCEYDPQSNRLRSTSLPGDSATAPYTAKYEHDVHGNMTRMLHLPLMQWNFKDQLQATSQQVMNSGTPEMTFYVYDVAGQRVRKVTERQVKAGQISARMKERIYLGGYEIYREYASNGQSVTLQRDTLHIMDGKKCVALLDTKAVDVNGVPNILPSTVTRYQYSNHLNSASLELDGEGAVISYEEYYPYGSTAFGAVASDLGVSVKRYRYTGKERDDESGLYYYGARYYASWLGEWTSADPIGLDGGINLFEYARSNPVMNMDPSGMWVDPALFIDNPNANPTVIGGGLHYLSRNTGEFASIYDAPPTITSTSESTSSAPMPKTTPMGPPAWLEDYMKAQGSAPDWLISEEAEHEAEGALETIIDAEADSPQETGGGAWRGALGFVQGFGEGVAHAAAGFMDFWFGKGPIESTKEAAGDLASRAGSPAEAAILSVQVVNPYFHLAVGFGHLIEAIGKGDPRAAGQAVGQLAGAAVIARVLEPGGRRNVEEISRLPQKGRVEFAGFEVRGVRDLSHLSESTLKAMADKGFAAKDIKARSIILHHNEQNPAGWIVEVPASKHSIGNPKQHPFGAKAGSGLTAEERAAFGKWRVEYWKARAREELNRRGAQ